jgi:hypothetical protein
MDHLDHGASLRLLLYLHLLLSLCFLFAMADLTSEKQALFAFASAVYRGNKLNWNQNISLCSWHGVTCSPDGSRISALRVPAAAFIGTIPPNTLGRLISVRNVISGSPDRETDPIRALIGGACRVWQWVPSRAAPQ